MAGRSHSDDEHNGLFSSFSTQADSPALLSPGSTLVGAGNSPSPRLPRHRAGYQALTPALTPQVSFGDHHEGDIGAHGSPDDLGISAGREARASMESQDSVDPDRFNAGFSDRSGPYSFSSTTPLRSNTQGYHKAKTSDFDPPRRSGTSLVSRKSIHDFSPHCASREEIWKGARHHIYITFLLLGIFSTIFSGIYLGIAIARPTYGKFISDRGNLTYSNATLVFALFAKLIELSFVTVFIGFVGQVISQRAFNKDRGYGVTLAEISMRGWIMQPGQMLVHPHAVKYALVSLMGFLAIIAALTAMLYTTAASALVSPQLMFSKFYDRTLQNDIRQGFGDVSAVQFGCEFPIRTDPMGDSTKFATCLAPNMAAQSLNNWSTWLAQWASFGRAGSNDQRSRPPPYGLVSDNTTVQGAWIEISDMGRVSNAYDRIVNNVTMAMPHAGLIDAALNPNNSILQPKANDGFGSYNIHASVLSPAINVLCAEMSEDELVPLVYDHWPNANKSMDFPQWANLYAGNSTFVPSYGENQWLNRTIVDQIFGFGPEFGQRRPPVFPKLPIAANTLLNNTGAYAPLPYRDATYVLGAISEGQSKVTGYNLCQLRGFRTTSCSSWYNATSSQSHMQAQCEDDEDPLQYSKNQQGKDALTGNGTTSVMWVDLADVWGSAVTLGAGITDGDAANARILTQLIPTGRGLDPTMPSIAEALAVLAGSTLMLGTRNAPMHSMTDLEDKSVNGTTTTFTSRIQSQQYASGPVSSYQNAFYIILVAVFGGNVLVLTWLILNRGLVTDFCDPANLFSVTINSPPSHVFAGSCGCGPEAKQYREKWFINVDGEHVYLENDERDQELAASRSRQRATTAISNATSPIMAAYSKLSKRKSVF